MPFSLDSWLTSGESSTRAGLLGASLGRGFDALYAWINSTSQSKGGAGGDESPDKTGDAGDCTGKDGVGGGLLSDAQDKKKEATEREAKEERNSRLVQDRAAPLARVIEAQCGTQFTPRQFVAAAYEHILSRKPSEPETLDCEAFLKVQENTIRRDGLKERRVQPECAARESLVRVLLNHNDFLTVH